MLSAFSNLFACVLKFNSSMLVNLKSSISVKSSKLFSCQLTTRAVETAKLACASDSPSIVATCAISMPVANKFRAAYRSAIAVSQLGCFVSDK
jgi:hypothetical protein